jgi:hypothetical protein
MKKLLVIAVVLLVVALAMAATCPDRESFKTWLGQQKAGKDASFVDRAADSVLDAQTSVTADYHDRILWATMEATRGTEKHRYLGVFGTWFDLSR